MLAASGYAAYYGPAYGTAAAESGRAVSAVHGSINGVTTAYSAGLVADGGTSDGIRVVGAGSVIGCHRLGRFETRGAGVDADEPMRAMRFQAQALERRANTLVVSTPPPWPLQVRVEMYDCPD